MGSRRHGIDNLDTILLVSSDIIGGGVYRTTNGGLNWSPLGPTSGSDNHLQFICSIKIWILFRGSNVENNQRWLNWFVIPGESYQDIKFFDTSKDGKLMKNIWKLRQWRIKLDSPTIAKY